MPIMSFLTIFEEQTGLGDNNGNVNIVTHMYDEAMFGVIINYVIISDMNLHL